MDALLILATDPTTVAIMAVIFGAVVVRSAFGFGDVLVSVPILTLFVSPKMVIPLMGLVGATNALLMLWRERGEVRWHPVRFLLMASVVGVPIGVRTPLDVQLRHGLPAKVRRRARRLWPKGTAACCGPPGVTFRCGLTPPAWSLPTPDGLRSVPGIDSQSRVW